MRTLRLSLTGTAMLAVLGGLSVAVVAQDEEPAPVTFVSGTVTKVYGYDVYDEDESDLYSYDSRGYEIMTQSGGPLRQVVEWSDPRLPTDLWLAVGYTIIQSEADERDGAMNAAWQSLLEDEEGRWRGTGRLVIDADEWYSLYVLTGEGAYEGLSALLHGVTPADFYGPWDIGYEGYIFEAELTPFPDEPVPATTGALQMYPFPMEPPAE